MCVAANWRVSNISTVLVMLYQVHSQKRTLSIKSVIYRIYYRFNILRITEHSVCIELNQKTEQKYKDKMLIEKS